MMSYTVGDGSAVYLPFKSYLWLYLLLLLLIPFPMIKLSILYSWCYVPYCFMRQLKSIIPNIVGGTKSSEFLLAQYLLSLSVFKLWPVASLPTHQWPFIYSTCCLVFFIPQQF